MVCLIAVFLCACSGGADGANGIDGTNGKSAYEIWLDAGHSGTETDFLAWLKGSDGSDGDNGSKGDKGDKGDKGETGAQGGNGQNGQNGLSAYEIFLTYYPYYTGTEEQWINGLINGELKVHTVTFKTEVADDIVKYVFDGYALADIPAVPEKEGQTSAAWSVTDFSSITQDLEVNAVYDMRKYVTFHNEFTDDEDTVITVNYGDAITDIPQITAKVGNDSRWSITDFSEIKTDLTVEAIYETQGLQFTLVSRNEYKVARGDDMDRNTSELLSRLNTTAKL
ncbi:MAG: hypothetical protein NC184_03980 [Roseburia sp.]|nr:hypothetical protein [Roseburia sp.]